MKLYIEAKCLAAALLLCQITTGCQLSKAAFARNGTEQVPPHLATTNDAIQSPRVTPARAESSDVRSMEVTDNDGAAIAAASKRIDNSMTSALKNEVPLEDYNATSRNAAYYPTVAKVVPSKSSGGCSSGCSH